MGEKGRDGGREVRRDKERKKITTIIDDEEIREGRTN